VKVWDPGTGCWGSTIEGLRHQGSGLDVRGLMIAVCGWGSRVYVFRR